MSKMNTIHNAVKRILEEQPATRSDDWLLTLEVWKEYAATDLSVDCMFKHHAELCVPSISSITRARRKVQRENPELVDAEARAIRKKHEREMRKYALDNQ